MLTISTPFTPFGSCFIIASRLLFDLVPPTQMVVRGVHEYCHFSFQKSLLSVFNLVTDRYILAQEVLHYQNNNILVELREKVY